MITELLFMKNSYKENIPDFPSTDHECADIKPLSTEIPMLPTGQNFGQNRNRKRGQMSKSFDFIQKVQISVEKGTSICRS
jgi:hypothetical protein